MTLGNKIFWLIFVIVFLLINTLTGIKKTKHIMRIITAKKIYKKINNIKNDNNGWLFSYLRKIDPYVFEELILYSFKKYGYKIKRNKRYTHDGGIDGRIKKNGQKYIIQAKRYSEYIKPSHVQEFIKVCRTKKNYGYFIHTGKTGEEVKEIINNNPQIKIISGKKLYEFFIFKQEKSSDLFF